MSIYTDVANVARGYESDENAVRQSLVNLFNTSKGERLFNPNIGLVLDDSVFELATELAEFDIETKLRAELGQEPRIEIIRLLVVSNPTDHGFDVTIHYRVKGLSVTDVFEGTIVKAMQT